MGSRFLSMMHPKTDIAPTRDAIKRILAAGWWGQLKVHGHRAQVHVPSSTTETPLVYNRQGALHKKVLPAEVAAELGRIFRPQAGWNVIDAEWLKSEDKLFVFDLMKREGVALDNLSYADRYALLPRVYSSPKIVTLPPLKTVDACLAVLDDPAPHVEGLVFKSPTARGFLDSSIVRCRKPEARR